MANGRSEANEWVEFCTGPNASVWMHPQCQKEMHEIQTSDRAKIVACMKKMYCAMENSNSISSTKLNRNEGRHGPDNLRVQAFKAYQGRVYGVEGSVKGKRAFFASAAAVKKDDKADPSVLKRAAERAASAAAIPGAAL